MKTRKRGRSPTQDCEECLPISKRITRLNIQAANRQSVDDKDGQNEQQFNCGCGSVHTSPHVDQSPLPYTCQSIHQTSPAEGQSPWQCQTQLASPASPANVQWQYNCPGTSPPVPSNNNLNYLPCGSQQCGQSYFEAKNSLHTYASQHGIPMDDLKGYRPELDESQNPHYYRINSLLYEAHVEKARRNGMEMNQ